MNDSKKQWLNSNVLYPIFKIIKTIKKIIKDEKNSSFVQ